MLHVVEDADIESSKYFFNVVKEGDQVVFATDDDNERALWVQAIYRATGQSHKPTPPATHQPSRAPVSNTQISRMRVGKPRWRCRQLSVALINPHNL